MLFSCREFGISEEKLIEIQDCLIKRSFSDKAAARQGAIWALGEMNIHREDAYLTVVRRLIDDNKSVRGEAKRVLEKLTGTILLGAQYITQTSFNLAS